MAQIGTASRALYPAGTRSACGAAWTALTSRIEPWLPPWPAAVLVSAMAVHRLPAIPPAAVSLALLGLGIVLLVRGRQDSGRVLRFVALLLAAAGWTMLRADVALGERLQPSQEGIDFVVQGHVSGMPRAVERGNLFMFHIERCVGSSARSGPPCPAGSDVRLGWYRSFGAPPVVQGARPTLPSGPRPGERWQLTVRLKRPHGLLNPHGFDAELRALEEGVNATGSVRTTRDTQWPNQRLDGRSWRPGLLVEAARTVLRDAIVEALAAHRDDARGVVAALTVGDQAAIPGRWWEVFNRTGVGHLMSISGLHITMLAGMAGAVAGRILRNPRFGRTRLLERWPASQLRWGVALAVAFLYSALAGWGIPAQRTCWMLAVAAVAVLSGRSQSLARVLALSAALVTVLDPWAPLAAGFWLSFASVGAIIWYGTRPAPAEPRLLDRRTRRRVRLRRLLADAARTQWAATLALLPLGALFFSSFSLVGPLANAFAIPLVSIVITPLALLGTALLLLWPAVGGVVLGAVCVATGGLLDALLPLAAPRFAIAVLPAPPWPATVAAALAIVALLAPLRVPGRPAAFAALLPLFAPGSPRPAPGTLVVTALDIGQGAAILVETPSGRLLFDAGPRWGGDSEAGARVIVPYLRARGIDRLEALVVSHADDDHAGGAPGVQAGMQIDWVASSMEDDHPVAAGAAAHYRCLRGQRWTWGEASFEFLHPGSERTRSKKSVTNANSCVLRVASPAGIVLLTGDIEEAQERLLLEKLGTHALRADVLAAPHHGSAGSSSMPFLRAVSPALTLVQAGYRNRYRHPAEKSLVRYRIAGTQVLRTDHDGAVSVTLREGREPVISRLRRDNGRYWRIQAELPASPPDSTAPNPPSLSANSMASTEPSSL